MTTKAQKVQKARDKKDKAKAKRLLREVRPKHYRDAPRQPASDRPKPSLVCYSGGDDCIVAPYADEEKLLLDYFVKGGRKLRDYDRTCHWEPVMFGVDLRVW